MTLSEMDWVADMGAATSAGLQQTDRWAPQPRRVDARAEPREAPQRISGVQNLRGHRLAAFGGG